MKIALIGSGKTGGAIATLLPAHELVAVFNRRNPPTVEALRQADVVIVFVPADAVAAIYPIVLASGVNAIWGSTGFVWPTDLNQQVIQAGASWCLSHNFSLGMTLVRRCLAILGQGRELLGNGSHYHIHEVHHIHKQDAPSGTALSWQQWLGQDCEISAERIGDVNGIHQLTISTPFETIRLEHQAEQRAVFAHGAIWAARVLHQSHKDVGVYSFAELVDSHFAEACV